jgi:hypothetical protein
VRMSSRCPHWLTNIEGKNWSIPFENKTFNQNYSNCLSILNEACDKHIVKLYYTCLVYKLIWQFSTICLVGYFCPLIEK